MNPMWMIFASIAAVLLLTAAFFVHQYLVRRRREKAPLPPLCTTDDHVSTPSSAPALQVLSRDALVNPNRTLNVHGWDDTPDAEGELDLSAVSDAPRILDRDFLSRGRPGAQG